MYVLGVQISGNFAPGYPELFFERVPGTQIFVMFPKITLKRASRHPGSGTCWHTSMNSLDLLCSMFEQCQINFRKSQTYRINFENPSIYEVYEVQKYIYNYRLHDFCRRSNKQNFTPCENIQKRSLFSKGKVPEWSTNVKGFRKGQSYHKTYEATWEVSYSVMSKWKKNVSILLSERDTHNPHVFKYSS